MRYRVHRVEEGDWERLRELRLAALQDAPTGFLETYADAARHDEAAWRARARRWTEEPISCAFFAEAEGMDGGDGGDVGLMGGYLDAPGRVTVVAVFVRPEHRGRPADVVGLLLEAIAGWARTRDGVSHLRLEVHEDNARAIAAYRRRGFVETGVTAPYPLDPGRASRSPTGRGNGGGSSRSPRQVPGLPPSAEEKIGL